MTEPAQSPVQAELDDMGSIILSTCDGCCTIQLLCNILSPPYFPLQPPAYEPLSWLDQGYS